MPRNLDLTSLRSLVAVAEYGGVTRAAGYLNLTQSAVSMQLKRLEEGLGLSLLDRSSRTVNLTATGEQLVSYARRMLEINDEACARLTDDAFKGQVVLGVPHDIIYPALPPVLRQFHQDYPRMQVHLLSGFTRGLKQQFENGECDAILTTEDECGFGGERLAQKQLLWVGNRGGTAWRKRPLMLAFESRCMFRPKVQRALTQAGIPWEMTVESEHMNAIDAAISADLGISARLEGSEMSHFEVVDHGGALPDLGWVGINIYQRDAGSNPALRDLAALLRQAYGSHQPSLMAAS